MQTQPNILFIIIDALRARNLSCYGYPKLTSPNIDNLAKEGILFEDAYSCANATDPSLTTIFSGKYPTSHGIIHHGRMAIREDVKRLNERKIKLLPEILKLKNYRTLAVDWLGRWHKGGYDYYTGISQKRRAFNLLKKNVLNFARLDGLIGLFLPTLAKPYEDARVVTNEAIKLIKENHKKKFFLFIHYWDTHSPYLPPSRYVKKFYDEDEDANNNIELNINEIPYQVAHPKYKNYLLNCIRDATNVAQVIARYDGAIAFVDHEIGRLIETLERYSILDQTLIILTSDHGESLTEHGIYFEHHGLYDVSIHVPLILSYSELPKGKRIKGFVQHFDIVPTIFDILNIKIESDFDGKSLLPLIYNEVSQLHSAVYAEEATLQRKRAIRTAEYKYIYALSKKDAICKYCGKVHGGVEELYDLNKDPGENENIVKRNPKKANELKKVLLEWIKNLRDKNEKANVKEKIKELKRLGKI